MRCLRTAVAVVEHDLAFRGFGAFDTVAHCAAVAAAEGVVSPADVIKASPQAAAEAAAEATAEAAADAAAEETEEADTVPLAPLAHSSSGRRSQRTGPAEHAGDSAGVHSSGAPVPPPTGAQPERELAPAAASLTSERCARDAVRLHMHTTEAQEQYAHLNVKQLGLI